MGHLRLNNVVQGDQIVLEGVEECEASLVTDALSCAVAATNATCATAPEPTPNVSQPHADAIASDIKVE